MQTGWARQAGLLLESPSCIQAGQHHLPIHFTPLPIPPNSLPRQRKRDPKPPAVSHALSSSLHSALFSSLSTTPLLFLPAPSFLLGFKMLSGTLEILWGGSAAEWESLNQKWALELGCQAWKAAFPCLEKRHPHLALGTGVTGGLGSAGGTLDWMIFVAFPTLNDSMISHSRLQMGATHSWLPAGHEDLWVRKVNRLIWKADKIRISFFFTTCKTEDFVWFLIKMPLLICLEVLKPEQLNISSTWANLLLNLACELLNSARAPEEVSVVMWRFETLKNLWKLA